MTLVLPIGVDQITSAPLFSGSSQNSNMPCVFDNDAFERDFESALMRDWATEINDYSLPAEDSPMKTPSESSDLKRKSPVDSDVSPPNNNKKARFDSSPADSPFLDSGLLLDSSSSSSGSSSSSSEGGGSEEEEPDCLPPPRPQMWSSRQRWKDERKKVLKMSISKLAEIEDPELCLLRSVLINNTIKRLHADIKSERSAKLRQKVQQRMDFFAAASAPFYDDASSSSDCSEMFADDFLRGGPDRRTVSSPIPTRTSEPPCDSDNSKPPTQQQPQQQQPRKPTPVAPPVSAPVPTGGGQQCAMQYSRTSRDLRGGFGDASFPPRVPILDSVVYHSLLASLESS